MARERSLFGLATFGALFRWSPQSGIGVVSIVRWL